MTSDLLAADIPRSFTALAEWLACMVFLLNTKRRKDAVFWGISAAFLAGMSAFLVLTDDVAMLLWIPCMLVAIFLMLLFLRCGSGSAWLACGYCCARAFLTAELAASLEWQIYYYLLQLHPEASDSLPLKYGCLAVVYFLVFSLAWWLECNWLTPTNYDLTTWKELGGSVVIGAAAFAISNLSFVWLHTPFTADAATDIYLIRTLVDVGGLAIVLAYQVQRNELRGRYELETMNTLLQSQYAQYRQSRESIALVNQKYHDLKQQIAVLRRETDSSARNACLDRLQEEIRSYEAQNKTGNDVLDTVLTAKSLLCQQHGITITCVADGSLLGFLDTMDLCAVFGNALDNAIEYLCTLEDPEKRLIQLSVSRQKHFVMISVSNYFEGELTLKDGVPRTTKGDEAFHGYGIQSIRRIAAKYGGSAAVDVAEHQFSLRILLPQGGEQRPGSGTAPDS